jgi:hypothetical protein
MNSEKRWTLALAQRQRLRLLLSKSLSIDDGVEQIIKQLRAGEEEPLPPEEREKLVAVVRRRLELVQYEMERERARARPKENGIAASSPPAAAEWMIALVSRGKAEQGVLGDLSELFCVDAERFGVTRARRLYWARAVQSLGPLAWSAAVKIAKWGVVADIVRRLSGH